MPQSSQHPGFSMIEIVVVITILGILAAFAVPRFSSLEVEARSAATTALGGSLRTKAALAHALWLGQNQPESVMLDDISVDIANGYPDAASIAATIADLEGFAWAEAGPAAEFIRLADDQTPIRNCSVTYAAPEVLGAAPSVTVDVTGC